MSESAYRRLRAELASYVIPLPDNLPLEIGAILDWETIN